MTQITCWAIISAHFRELGDEFQGHFQGMLVLSWDSSDLYPFIVALLDHAL
jgi:hypothetical protein